MLGLDKVIYVKNERNCQRDKESAFLATALFTISDPLHIIVGCFLSTYAVGVLSVRTLHVTRSAVSLPVPPEALISCWESPELDEGRG